MASPPSCSTEYGASPSLIRKSQTKLEEGNVFTDVCLFEGGGGGISGTRSFCEVSISGTRSLLGMGMSRGLGSVHTEVLAIALALAVNTKNAYSTYLFASLRVQCERTLRVRVRHGTWDTVGKRAVRILCIRLFTLAYSRLVLRVGSSVTKPLASILKLFLRFVNEFKAVAWLCSHAVNKLVPNKFLITRM